jgi:hypothetical protein
MAGIKKICIIRTMSSTLRTVASNVVLPQPGCVIIISYSGLPIQFSYDRTTATLDFIFANGFDVNADINRTTTFYVRGSNKGGIHLVDNIGPNFISWLETNEGVDVGSISVHEKPIVFRANLLLPGREPNNDHAMFESTSEISFVKSAGDEANNYFATYLFKSPLVLKYTKSSITYYRCFTTQFSPQT